MLRIQIGKTKILNGFSKTHTVLCTVKLCVFVNNEDLYV